MVLDNMSKKNTAEVQPTEAGKLTNDEPEKVSGGIRTFSLKTHFLRAASSEVAFFTTMM